jgi:hypothetical protein
MPSRPLTISGMMAACSMVISAAAAINSALASLRSSAPPLQTVNQFAPVRADGFHQIHAQHQADLADVVKRTVERLVDAAERLVFLFRAVEGDVVIGVHPIAEGVGHGLGVVESSPHP